MEKKSSPLIVWRKRLSKNVSEISQKDWDQWKKDAKSFDKSPFGNQPDDVCFFMLKNFSELFLFFHRSIFLEDLDLARDVFETIKNALSFASKYMKQEKRKYMKQQK